MRVLAKYIGTSEISWLDHGKFYYLEVTTDVVSGVISIEKINSLGNVSNTLLCAKIEQFLSSFTNITNIEK